MTDPLFQDDDRAGEPRLRALFGSETPIPVRDPAFVHAAMHRIARRRFWFNLSAGLPWLIAVSAALWAFRPVIADVAREAARWWEDSAPLAHGLARLIVLMTPAAAVLLGLVFLAPAHERRL